MGRGWGVELDLSKAVAVTTSTLLGNVATVHWVTIGLSDRAAAEAALLNGVAESLGIPPDLVRAVTVLRPDGGQAHGHADGRRGPHGRGRDAGPEDGGS